MKFQKKMPYLLVAIHGAKKCCSNIGMKRLKMIVRFLILGNIISDLVLYYYAPIDFFIGICVRLCDKFTKIEYYLFIYSWN